MRFILSCCAVLVAAVAIYARTTAYGFFSDDFGWLLGAESFTVSHLFELSNRDHFYRPVVEIYFRAVMPLCGRSSSCYHWLSVLVHAVAGVAAVIMARGLSGSWSLGVLTGVLFVLQPAPVEAVIWISAIGEVLSAAFFVLTVWLFYRANERRELGPYVAACLTFAASLLAHESGVTLIAVLCLLVVLFPDVETAETRITPSRIARALRRLWPFLVMIAAYGTVAYIINSRNYVITQGQYGIGTHIARNVLGAIVTLSVGPRGTAALIIVSLLCLWCALAAPPRVQFYTAWTLITLLPSAGFVGGLNSRYLYLPAIGFAGLTAELVWWARRPLTRWASAGVAVWWALLMSLMIRNAAFAGKNVRTWERASAPYLTYVARVRELYPSAARGATLAVPSPPSTIAPHYIPLLLRWEFDDTSLQVVVRQP